MGWGWGALKCCLGELGHWARGAPQRPWRIVSDVLRPKTTFKRGEGSGEGATRAPHSRPARAVRLEGRLGDKSIQVDIRKLKA